MYKINESEWNKWKSIEFMKMYITDKNEWQNDKMHWIQIHQWKEYKIISLLPWNEKKIKITGREFKKGGSEKPMG